MVRALQYDGIYSFDQSHYEAALDKRNTLAVHGKTVIAVVAVQGDLNLWEVLMIQIRQTNFLLAARALCL